MICRHQSVRTGILTYIAVNAASRKINACAKNNCFRMENSTGNGFYTCDSFINNSIIGIIHNIFSYYFRDFLLSDCKMFLIFQDFTHAQRVVGFICLSTERMNSRTFRLIKHLRLYEGLVDVLSHLTAECIKFSYKVTLRAPSYIRITGHESNTLNTDRKYICLKTKSRAGKRCFASGMSRTDYHYIAKFFYDRHTLISQPSVFLSHATIKLSFRNLNLRNYIILSISETLSFTSNHSLNLKKKSLFHYAKHTHNH